MPHRQQTPALMCTKRVNTTSYAKDLNKAAYVLKGLNTQPHGKLLSKIQLLTETAMEKWE